MLEDPLSLMGRYGQSGPEGAVGSIGAGVGQKVMVDIFTRAAAWWLTDQRYQPHIPPSGRAHQNNEYMIMEIDHPL